jgi:hypothetical protein
MLDKIPELLHLERRSACQVPACGGNRRLGPGSRWLYGLLRPAILSEPPEQAPNTIA